jgi:hypothetical protein
VDKIRKLLKDLMSERGLKESPLSKRLGKNPAYLNQYFERGSPKVLPEDVRDQLSEIFDLAPESFKTGQRIPRVSSSPGPMLLEDAEPMGRVIQSAATLLPDGSTALIFRFAEGPSIVVAVGQDALEQIRKNLSTIEHHLKRS